MTEEVGSAAESDPSAPRMENALDAYREQIRLNALWREYQVHKPRCPVANEPSLQKKFRPLQVNAAE